MRVRLVSHACESEETCPPCERDGCGHLLCEHQSREGFDAECGECECPQHLAFNDCPDCNGTGVQSHWYDDVDMHCLTCRGSGVRQ